jgi:hypothetical protein
MSSTHGRPQLDSSGATIAAAAVALAPWPTGMRGPLAVLVLSAGAGLRVGVHLGGHGPHPAYPVPPILKVDPSTAPAHVLEALPQLGPGLAGRIAAERQAGRFASPDDLRRRVHGLGQATMANLARHLRLEGGKGEEKGQ